MGEENTRTTTHILVLGGCRSGKSRYALDAANRLGGDNKIYLATSVPTDHEMTARVVRHQAERGKDWRTVEEPVNIHDVINTAGPSARVILVDCLTLWTSNLLFEGRDEAGIVAAIDLVTQALQQCPCPVYLVSNEVGHGIVPENRLARQFRDMAGLVNQRMAQAVDQVIYTVAGIPVQIKPAGMRSQAGGR